MPSMKRLDVTPIDVDPNGIAEDQTLGGAGALTLNGALSDLGTAGVFSVADAGYGSGIAGVRIGLESSGNLSGVTFTITGVNAETQSPDTETLAGPNNTTVESAKFWASITQIAADAAVGTNVEVGPVDEFVTHTVPINVYGSDAVSFAVTGLSGTIQYDVEQTFDEVLRSSGPWTWVDVASNKSADDVGSMTQGASAARLRADSYSSGATLQFYVDTYA